MNGPGPRPLPRLLADAGLPAAAAPDVAIRDITADSRAVRPGSLFVAIPGTRADGHDFAGPAAAAGAAALVVERAPADPAAASLPLVYVDDARSAIARLAAAWYGHPAQRMPLVGITGTVGKTSMLTVTEAILRAAGVRVGTIGSLGLRLDGGTLEESSYTVPEPLLLHRWLARLAEGGCGLVVMEVTSHALVQERVAGLRYAAGAFTNLVPLEHAEFHGSFRAYVEAKSRLFDHMEEQAPLVYNADDRAVRRIVRDRAVQPVGCGSARTADVRIERVHVTAGGTRFVLHVRRPLPRIDGGMVAPFRLPLALALLGRSNLVNVVLGAALSLVAGAAPDALPHVLASLPAPRRRMQLVHADGFLVLDDTVGHPDSVSVVFETVEQLAPRRVHAVWAVRGQRGSRINRYNAEALAIWRRRVPLATLVVTRSADTADERNRVSDEEYDAFLRPLRRAGVAFEESAALAPAVQTALARAGAGDLVLLLGAQGMDRGAAVAQAWIREHVRSAPADDRAGARDD